VYAFLTALGVFALLLLSIFTEEILTGDGNCQKCYNRPSRDYINNTSVSPTSEVRQASLFMSGQRSYKINTTLLPLRTLLLRSFLGAFPTKPPKMLLLASQRLLKHPFAFHTTEELLNKFSCI
jgi:hypothetical protein